MPNLLYLVRSLSPHAELSQILTLCEQLVGGDFQPHVCSLEPFRARDQPIADRLTQLGVPLHTVSRRHRLDPFARHQLRRLSRRIAPSVIHAWGWEAACHAPAPTNSAHILTLGRLDPATSAVPPVVRNRHLSKRFRWVCVSCDQLREQAIVMQADGDRIQVIPPGVQTNTAAESEISREVLFEQLGLPEGARVIALVAQQVPRKGLQELLWAADLVRVLCDDMRLLVLGDGPQRPALERFARMASDLDHIRFLGTRFDVPSILPYCEMLWHAGDELSPPLAVLEAMAAGIPVVADETPGAKLAIDHGETGLLVPRAARAARGRATEQLLNDNELRGSLGTAAQQMVQDRFSSERFATDYLEIYQQSLAVSQSEIASNQAAPHA